MPAERMNFMRQDALRRSQEMHRRPPVSERSPQGRLDLNADMPPVIEPTVPPPPPTAPVRTPLPSVVKELLSEGLSGDRLLVAALILLLLREGGDIGLVLALGYILL